MQVSECYRLLGVTRNASFDDIKMAYRRLARKYHPDVNQDDPAATDKFRLIQQAYQILKDVDAGILPKSASPPPTSTVRSQKPASPPPPQKPAPQAQAKQAQARAASTSKVKIEVKNVRQQDPLDNDPELKLKLDMLRRLQDLLKQKKYVVAIAISEGMRARFPKAPEVMHWQAVAYHRWATELILGDKLREAEIYLHKALNADPSNRELCFEVRRDLERVKKLGA